MRNQCLIYYSFALLFLSFASCKPANSTTTDTEDSTAIRNVVSNPLPTISTTASRSGTFRILTVATGLLRTPEQSRLSFRIGGTIAQITARNGLAVGAGQVLARLDDRDQRMALRLAQDQVTESMVQLRGLVAEYGGEEVDTASVKNPKARAFVLTKSGYYKAQTALAQARQQLDYTVLRAPFKGVVANLTARPYNFITSYEPFCMLLSRAGLLVEFSVLESELQVVRVGQPVQVQPLARPGKNYSGQVVEVNPFVSSQGLVLVKARLTQSDEDLFEGMNARVVVEQRIEGQLIIPKVAVVERSGRKVVFTAEGGLAKWHYVTIAHENDTEVAIGEGLRAGERVITSGHLNLAHDAPITEQQP